MRTLVTGAAGMIGSHLVDHLLSDGHQVIGLDNLLTGQDRNLRSAQADPDFSFVLADIADEDALASVGPVERVFHLACPASPADFSTIPFEILRASSAGTMAVASFAQRHGARLVLASTSEIYGEPQVHPQTESYRGNVSPIGPRACYDEGKRFSEAVVSSFVRSGGLDGAIARIFNTYGPRMRIDDGRVVSNFVVQALRGDPLTIQGSGDQTRSFCFVDDQVAGLVALMESGESGPCNFVDVDPEHWTMDPVSLRAALSPGDVAMVVAVDTFGHPLDHPALQAECDTAGVPLVADSAAALGSTVDGRPVGAQATAHAFSMSFVKVLPAGGAGGAVVLPADAPLDGPFGWTRSALMNELHAIVALDQLDVLDDLVVRRNRVAALYTEVADLLGLQHQQVRDGVHHSWVHFVLRIPGGPTERDRVERELAAKGVGTKAYFLPLPGSDGVFDPVQVAGPSLEVTDRLGAEVLALPMSSELNDEAVDRVSIALEHVLR